MSVTQIHASFFARIVRVEDKQNQICHNVQVKQKSPQNRWGDSSNLSFL